MSLYRRKRSPFYWSKLYAGGLVHRFSTGERHKVKALEKEREEARRLTRLFRAEADKSVATLAAQFVENAEATNRSPATRAMMERHMSATIIPFLGADRSVSSIAIRDLEDYKAARMKKVGPGTVSKELSTLRQMLDFGGNVLKLFPPGETPNTRSPKMAKYSPKWRLLTGDELGRLLSELQRQERKGKEAVPFFLLMMNTGMRSGEPAKLRWEWVDLAAKEIHLPAEVTKTRTARSVPLNESARAALAMVKREPAIGRVFRFATHYTAWHRAVHAAGLSRLENRSDKRPTTSGVRPHDLRHSYGSLLYAAGASTPEVRDILGHATLMMANLYAHTFKERLHSAVNATVVSVPMSVPLGGASVPETVAKRPKASSGKNRRSATAK